MCFVLLTSRFATGFFNCVLRQLPCYRNPPKSLLVSLVSSGSNVQEPLNGGVSAQKALQGSEIETRDFMHGKKENSILTPSQWAIRGSMPPRQINVQNKEEKKWVSDQTCRIPSARSWILLGVNLRRANIGPVTPSISACQRKQKIYTRFQWNDRNQNDSQLFRKKKHLWCWEQIRW